MENKDITEDILLKNGFKNDGTYVFTYRSKNCAVDIWYGPWALRNRHWHCTIYTEDCKYILADAAIQTVDQFNSFIKIMDVDCAPLKC